jgi:hypothetical protein
MGNRVRFVLLPGLRRDTNGVTSLVEGGSFGALLAERAFAVIPSTYNRSRHSRQTNMAAINSEGCGFV